MNLSRLLNLCFWALLSFNGYCAEKKYILIKCTYIPSAAWYDGSEYAYTIIDLDKIDSLVVDTVNTSSPTLSYLVTKNGGQYVVDEPTAMEALSCKYFQTADWGQPHIYDSIRKIPTPYDSKKSAFKKDGFLKHELKANRRNTIAFHTKSGYYRINFWEAKLDFCSCYNKFGYPTQPISHFTIAYLFNVYDVKEVSKKNKTTLASFFKKAAL